MKNQIYFGFSEAQPNLSKISASREKNASKQEKSELAHGLPSVSILYKYKMKSGVFSFLFQAQPYLSKNSNNILGGHNFW